MSKKNYTKKIRYSWEELEHDVKAISYKVLKDFEPEIVICISTGGWIPGRLLKNYINSATYYSIGSLAYDEQGNFTGKTDVIQKLSTGINISNKKVLVIDEVCETGGTIKTVTEYLRRLNPKEIKTAVLHLKSHAEYKADYYAHLETDKWIIYPWSLV